MQPQYLGLEELCQEFAVELLGMCRNQSEVTTILNSCGDESHEALDEQAFEEGIPNLSRLRLAVNYNQKQVTEDVVTRWGRLGLVSRTFIIIFAVCRPPHLPTSSVFNLVWQPGGLER